MARRAEGFALGAATLLVVAFVLSFVLGLFRGEASSAAPEQVVTRDAAPEPDAGVKGRVEVLNAFSAHADRNDLLAYAESAGNVRRIFLVHGEPDQQAPLRAELERRGRATHVAKRGETLELT